MNWIRTISKEVFGLFVDDGTLAVAILAWLAVVWFLLRQMRLPVAGGIVLSIGLAAILIESVTRFARHASRS